MKPEAKFSQSTSARVACNPNSDLFSICPVSEPKDRPNYRRPTYLDLVNTDRSIDKRRELKEYISSFCSIGQNWDGYNAIPPKEVTIWQAINFIKILKPSIINLINKEDVWITPYGTIEIDISKDNNLVSVEIGATKIGFFTKFIANENLELDGDIFNDFKIPELLNRAFEVLIP